MRKAHISFCRRDVERVDLIAAAGVACVLSGNLIYEQLFVPARASGIARRAPRAPGEALRKGVPPAFDRRGHKLLYLDAKLVAA